MARGCSRVIEVAVGKEIPDTRHVEEVPLRSTDSRFVSVMVAGMADTVRS